MYDIYFILFYFTLHFPRSLNEAHMFTLQDNNRTIQTFLSGLMKCKNISRIITVQIARLLFIVQISNISYDYQKSYFFSYSSSSMRETWSNEIEWDRMRSNSNYCFQFMIFSTLPDRSFLIEGNSSICFNTKSYLQ